MWKCQRWDKQALSELQGSLNQVKLMQEGKIEKQSAEDFLNFIAC